MNKIITIGREFGSGGRELGRRIAEELKIEYYDKEIMTEIAKNTSLSEEYIKQVTEHKPHNLFPITIGQSMIGTGDYYLQQIQSVHNAQSDIIKDLAKKSSCVIVGRCADYILKDELDMRVYRIFVYADIEKRIARCAERNADKEGLTEKEIKKQILEIDKNRAKYYEYYTGQKWGDRKNYEICINTTDMVIKNVAPYFAKMFEII